MAEENSNTQENQEHEANCYIVMDMQSSFELHLASDNGEQLGVPTRLNVKDEESGCIGVLPVYSSVEAAEAVFGPDTRALPAYINPEDAKEGDTQDECGQEAVVEGAEGPRELQLRLFVP